MSPRPACLAEASDALSRVWFWGVVGVQLRYITAHMFSALPSHAGLGTRLRHLIEVLDGDVARAYADLGLDNYRPRFTPVVRALDVLGTATIREISAFVGVSHSAASLTVTEMRRCGWVASRKGRDARERIVEMSPALIEILPTLKRQWSATARAEAAFNADLPYSLRKIVDETIEALQRKSFSEYIKQEGAATDD